MTEPHDTEDHNGGGASLPTENLFRAFGGGVTFRDAEPDAAPRLVGRFAVFNEWTEIDSIFEGRFMERIAPGAAKKTIRENRNSMRVLFQHGRDPYIGMKVLGPIEDVRETVEGRGDSATGGVDYEVELLDTDYVREALLPGLRAGVYGASFRFSIMREEIVDDPGVSDHNPHGLQERTIKEMKVMEFGPVTFPAYEGATAGVRSLTDEFLKDDLWRKIAKNPDRLRSLLLDDDEQRDEPNGDAPSEPSAGTTDPTPAPERRVERARGELVLPPPPPKRGGVLPGHQKEEGSWRPLRLP